MNSFAVQEVATRPKLPSNPRFSLAPCEPTKGPRPDSRTCQLPTAPVQARKAWLALWPDAPTHVDASAILAPAAAQSLRKILKFLLAPWDASSLFGRTNICNEFSNNVRRPKAAQVA